jgi:LAGLIDADG DNA endonuclease family
MGDGSVASYGIKFGTVSFSVKECVLLINVLNIKYNINCTIHMNKNKPIIYILAESKNIFISLIKSYLVPSIYNKLGLNKNNSIKNKQQNSILINSILDESFIHTREANKISANNLISIIIGSILGSCDIIKIENIYYLVVNKYESNEKTNLLLLYNKLAKLGYCKNIKPNFKFNIIKKYKNHYSYFKFIINLK